MHDCNGPPKARKWWDERQGEQKGYLCNHKRSRTEQNKKNDNKKRKQNPKLKSRIQLNVQPSLPKFWIELLRKVNEATKDIENFKYANVDMHRNLKFILNSPLNGKYMKYFRNENDIVDIVSAYCEEDKFWFIFTQHTICE